MSQHTNSLIKVGISTGDTNGVGLETIIKVFADQRMAEMVIPVIYGNLEVAKAHRKTLEIRDFSFNSIDSADDAKEKRVNFIEITKEDVAVEFGTPTAASAKCALESLEAAVKDLAANKVDVLITAPIDKDNLSKAGFKFPGHTEYLAEMSNVEDYLMLLVNGGLRVGVVTGHVPLKEVSEMITKEAILSKLELLNDSLSKDFGIRKPRIAVLGLNPHAGDNGLLGSEENEVIKPAIREAEEKGILTFGPYGADGLFGSDNFKNFDGILAMYHDQGLAPFKAMAFEEGVNYTAGLPIVRTSPDHGTAFNIAGEAKASEASMRQAIFLATDIYRNRSLHKEITANPLEPQKKQ